MWFPSPVCDLVKNPDDRFSQNEAHILNKGATFATSCEKTCCRVFRFTPIYTATEICLRLEILDIRTRPIVLSMKCNWCVQTCNFPPNSAEYMLSEGSETFHKNLSDNISNVMKLQLACLYSAINRWSKQLTAAELLNYYISHKKVYNWTNKSHFCSRTV